MSAKLLWKPTEERIKNTRIYSFMQKINAKHGTTLTDYAGLYQWSINNIPDFWASLWDEAGIIASLDLLRPIYRATASYGHFGRTEDTFTWERVDKVGDLKAAAARLG